MNPEPWIDVEKKWILVDKRYDSATVYTATHRRLRATRPNRRQCCHFSAKCKMLQLCRKMNVESLWTASHFNSIIDKKDLLAKFMGKIHGKSRRTRTQFCAPDCTCMPTLQPPSPQLPACPCDPVLHCNDDGPASSTCCRCAVAAGAASSRVLHLLQRRCHRSCRSTVTSAAAVATAVDGGRYCHYCWGSFQWSSDAAAAAASSRPSRSYFCCWSCAGLPLIRPLQPWQWPGGSRAGCLWSRSLSSSPNFCFILCNMTSLAAGVVIWSRSLSDGIRCSALYKSRELVATHRAADLSLFQVTNLDLHFHVLRSLGICLESAEFLHQQGPSCWLDKFRSSCVYCPADWPAKRGA